MNRKKIQRTAPAQGGVSKTTLVLVAVLAFCIGGYSGSLVTKHFGGNDGASSDSRIAKEVAAQIRHAEEHARKEPGNADVWIDLGNLYYDSHQHEKAISAYERSLAIKPRNADVLTDLGTMYLAVSRPQKAVDCFDRAISVAPAHQNAHLNKGFALLDLGRKADARAEWQKLLRINPKVTLKDGTPLTRLVQDLSKP